MRTLQVLGLTAGSEDGDVLVCHDPESGERFGVPADERLRAAARGDISRLGQLEIEMESQLRPREIQARIRAGASVAQVATEATTDPGRIERYAYPVLQERSTVAERGRLAHPMVGGVPARKRLGDVVAATLVERGQHTGVVWDAFKDDAGWVLAMRWRAGRSENRAHWAYHPGPDSGTVTARDDAAASLMDPAPRPLRTVPAAMPTGVPSTAIDRAAEAQDEDPPTQEIPAVPAVPPAEAVDSAPVDRFADRADRHLEDLAVDGVDQVDEVTETVLDDRSGAAGRVDDPLEESAARTGTESAGGARRPKSGGKQRPVMPSWEDVLLGGKGKKP